jgi:GTP-binding protein
LFDVSEPISQVDKSVASYIVEQHKPVLIVGNKIDLAERIVLERWDAYIKQQMPALRYAPVSFISAKDGRNVAATLDLLVDLRRQARTTFGTGELNRCLRQAQERQRPRTKKMPKLYYGTQLSTEPLRVLVFVNEPKLFKGNYGRYLENALRDHFAVPEVPIDVVFRDRIRRDLRGGDGARRPEAPEGSPAEPQLDLDFDFDGDELDALPTDPASAGDAAPADDGPPRELPD